jgi:hypothetical protein
MVGYIVKPDNKKFDGCLVLMRRESVLTRTDEESDEYRRLFLGIQERNLPDDVTFAETLARRSLGSGAALVTTARLTIAEDPAAAAPEIYRVGEECAVCGLVPPTVWRVPATLHIPLPKGGGLGLGVWAHPECLARCEQTGQQRGIPW